jgi:signal transduction histidine kinase
MSGAHDRRPGTGGAGALPRAVRAAERDLTLDDLVYINRMTTVGQVLPNVAHELNNALQIVGGLVEMLGARADLPRDVLDKVARIGAQSSRATVMIRDLVAFSRRDDGGVRLVDLGRIVEAALAMRRYHLSRARIAVTADTRGSADAALVQADAHALQQVLLNLLINAEHSMAGREGGRLAIVVSAGPDAVTVTVEDNGPGVPPDLRRRVTEPFFTTKGHAAGLGLTVAAALMERDGGALSLDHLPDGGTRAVMRLPARPRPG